MNNELWCPIKETEGCYEISNLGRVKSIQRKGTINNDKIIKPLLKKDNYYQVNLKFHGKSIWRRINRLVAQAFIPNPNNLPCVNHKDENKLNDSVSNLEWCSYSYNINYGTANNKRAKALGKKVNKIDIITNTILKTYDTISEASRDNKKCYISNIIKCCNHEYGFKTCGGFKWEYYKVGGRSDK